MAVKKNAVVLKGRRIKTPSLLKCGVPGMGTLQRGVMSLQGDQRRIYESESFS